MNFRARLTRFHAIFGAISPAAPCRRAPIGNRLRESMRRRARSDERPAIRSPPGRPSTRSESGSRGFRWRPRPAAARRCSAPCARRARRPRPARRGCRCRRCRSRCPVRPELSDLEAWNRAQQIARLRSDALRVRQMAGIVVDDPGLDRVPHRARLADLDEHLRDVAHTRREGVGARGPRRIVREQLAVLLHRRPAAGGVDDDPIDAGLLECGDQPSRERARLVDPSGVERQRAAAPLLGRRDHRRTLRQPAR